MDWLWHVHNACGCCIASAYPLPTIAGGYAVPSKPGAARAGVGGAARLHCPATTALAHIGAHAAPLNAGAAGAGVGGPALSGI